MFMYALFSGIYTLQNRYENTSIWGKANIRIESMYKTMDLNLSTAKQIS
jgi:hypothetical protein